MLLPQDYNISSQDFFVDFSFVSLVLANSETVFVDVDTSHLRHSPAVDAALGKSKQSMIAVPFVVMNRLCGVLTAVRLHLFAPFVIHETEVIERQTIALASLLESILIAFSDTMASIYDHRKGKRSSPKVLTSNRHFKQILSSVYRCCVRCFVRCQNASGQ